MLLFKIKDRFLGLKKVSDFFLFLTSEIILTFTSTELGDKTILLKQYYQMISLIQ